MIVAAMVVFFLSLALIVGLFTLKEWELSHGRVLLPLWRERADREAMHFKDLLIAASRDARHVPPLLLDAAQSVVHGIAVDAGHVAHWLGHQSHRLADSVSHKRNFERGETRSEFLKKVAEHKNGNGSDVASFGGDGEEPTSTV